MSMRERKRPTSRWNRRRLVTLGFLAILIASAVSWLAIAIRDQRKQKAAGEAIETAGGAVGYEQTWLGKVLCDDSLVMVNSVGLTGDSVTEDALVHLEDTKELIAMGMKGPHVTDATLVHLQGLSQLMVLTLERTRVTDAGLAHLKGLSQLRFLFLKDAEVTDAGLIHLYGLRHLRCVDLSGTRVTDEGVAALQRAMPLCVVDRGKGLSWPPRPPTP